MPGNMYLLPEHKKNNCFYLYSYVESHSYKKAIRYTTSENLVICMNFTLSVLPS